MKFSQVFKGYFKKYSDFSGRASRSEFWFTYLIWLLSLLLTSAVLCVSFFISPWLTGFLLITCTIAAFVLAMPGIKYCLKAIWKLDLYKKLLFFLAIAACIWTIEQSLNNVPGVDAISSTPSSKHMVTFALGLFCCIGSIVYFSFMSPVIAAFNRRMHDINLSGWWVVASYLLMGLFFKIFDKTFAQKNMTYLVICLVLNVLLLIVYLYVLCKKGNPEENKYGLPSM